MIREKDLVERLNFLRMFKKRVLQELDDQGRAKVLTLDTVPKSDGIYWAGGTAVLKNGTEVESVFRVNTDTGGTLLSSYWWIGSAWYETDEAAALSAAGCTKEDAFPFDWRYNTPLSEDIYHD